MDSLDENLPPAFNLQRNSTPLLGLASSEMCCVTVRGSQLLRGLELLLGEMIDVGASCHHRRFPKI